MPRDARGWTLPAPGNAGEERPGTTANARWLELERHCTVWVERDDGRVIAVHAVREGEWDQFFAAMHPGEPVEAVLSGRKLADVRIGEDESVAFDRDPGEFMFELVRVRGIPSCTLDEIDRHGKMGLEQIGDALGKHRTLAGRELRSALRKALDKAEEIGMDAEELMGALMGMGA